MSSSLSTICVFLSLEINLNYFNPYSSFSLSYSIILRIAWCEKLEKFLILRDAQCVKWPNLTAWLNEKFNLGFLGHTWNFSLSTIQILQWKLIIVMFLLKFASMVKYPKQNTPRITQRNTQRKTSSSERSLIDGCSYRYATEKKKFWLRGLWGLQLRACTQLHARSCRPQRPRSQNFFFSVA